MPALHRDPHAPRVAIPCVSGAHVADERPRHEQAGSPRVHAPTRSVPRVRWLGTVVASGMALGTPLALRRLLGGGYNLHRKVAVVTGGSRGLGLEVARVLLHHGARVIICVRTEAEIDRAVAHLKLAFPLSDVQGITCDVGTPEGAEKLASEVEHAWGRIDVLVNNAGVMAAGPAAHMTKDDYRASDGYALLGSAPDRERIPAVDAATRRWPHRQHRVRRRHALALFAASMGLVNRMLPSYGGRAAEGTKGRDIDSSWTSSWLTALIQRAADRNLKTAANDAEAT